MVFLEDAEVLKNVRVADGIHELACRAPQIAGEGKPGQFVHMTVSPHRSTISSPLLRRPFSFYGVNAEAGTVSILYRIQGLGTSLLAEARPGEHLSMLGPLGTGFTLPSAESPVFPVESTVPPMKSCASPVENAASPQEKAFSKVEKGVFPAKSTVLLVGGGMGIAPLVYLADSLVDMGCQVEVFYGAETCGELVALERLEQIGANCDVATVDGSAGYKGPVTDLFPFLPPKNAPDMIYSCGPLEMMAHVARFAKERGIPGEVSLESHMACGVGACLGCAVRLKSTDEGYAKVCSDGPVFSIDRLEFEAGEGERNES